MADAGNRLPDDTVFYAVFPVSGESLADLHLRTLDSIAPFTSGYIWQHQPFHLTPAGDGPFPPHLRGKTKFGDNLDDEWFIVFLLFHISAAFPSLSIQVADADGQFLLIEAAYSLPRWLNPDTAANRVFIRSGRLHIIPKTLFPTTPPLPLALTALSDETLAPDQTQAAILRRIADYPLRAQRNMHTAVARVPISVARVLREEPCLISAAVEGFYNRDLDSMKFAARMERFAPAEVVRVPVRMSRAMYAQLVRQSFQPPKGYPMPDRAVVGAAGLSEAELGLKIACGFEMMYQTRKRLGSDWNGSACDAYKESFESSGYFKGLLPGSQEYNVLLEKVKEHFRQSNLLSRSSDMLNAPVRRIDEILSLPYTKDDFDGSDVPPADDDRWLYDGETELNAVLQERQEEMEQYVAQQKDGNTQGVKSADKFPVSEASNLSSIAKSMQAFVQKVSSFEGAEIPESRVDKAVDFDVECFLKDIESAMGGAAQDFDNDSDGKSTSSEMDIDSEFEEDDDEGGDEQGQDSFMQFYSDVLNKQLKDTTLQKSFIRADQTHENPNNGASSSNASNSLESELTPVDVDMNLVKSLFDSVSSQQGLPGPASNLLGVMGLKLPEEVSKDA